MDTKGVKFLVAFEVDPRHLGDVMLALDPIPLSNLQSRPVRKQIAGPNASNSNQAPKPELARTTRVDAQGFSALDRAILGAIDQAGKSIPTKDIAKFAQTQGFRATGLHKRLMKLSAGHHIKRIQAGVYGPGKSRVIAGEQG